MGQQRDEDDGGNFAAVGNGVDVLRHNTAAGVARRGAPYSLRPPAAAQEGITLMSNQQMFEIEPPAQHVLGGVAQSHKDAPV